MKTNSKIITLVFLTAVAAPLCGMGFNRYLDRGNDSEKYIKIIAAGDAKCIGFFDRSILMPLIKDKSKLQKDNRDNMDFYPVPTGSVYSEDLVQALRKVLAPKKDKKSLREALTDHVWELMNENREIRRMNKDEFMRVFFMLNAFTAFKHSAGIDCYFDQCVIIYPEYKKDLEVYRVINWNDFSLPYFFIPHKEKNEIQEETLRQRSVRLNNEAQEIQRESEKFYGTRPEPKLPVPTNVILSRPLPR